MKKKIERRRKRRAVRRAIRTLHASSIEEALWEALRFRCEPPAWLDRPLISSRIVGEQYYNDWNSNRPKPGDLAGTNYFVDMADKYTKAVVTLLRAASPQVISKIGYYHDGALHLVYGVSRFTLASTEGFNTLDHRREGDGWAHHTIRANARAWKDACRRAGGDARYSRTEWAYESDHQVGVVPHGHEMALREEDGELYPQWHAV